MVFPFYVSYVKNRNSPEAVPVLNFIGMDWPLNEAEKEHPGWTGLPETAWTGRPGREYGSCFYLCTYGYAQHSVGIHCC